MSDPVTNAEVEDVLSSIRRLVSEDKRPLAKPEEPAAAPEPDKLVLTPSLRVAEDPETPDIATDSAKQAGSVADETPDPLMLEPDPLPEVRPHVPDLDELLDPEDEVSFSQSEEDDEVVVVTPTSQEASDPAEDYSDDPYNFGSDADDGVSDADAPAPVSMRHASDDAEAETPESAEIEDDVPSGASQPHEEIAAEVRPTGSDASSETVLTAKIEALETAIGKIEDGWEPDGETADENAATEAPAMDWPTEGDMDDGLQSEIDRAVGADSENATDLEAEPTVAAEKGAAPESPDRQLDIPIPPRPAIPENPASQTARRGEDPFGDGVDDQLIDEETLRDLVSEIVRSELQGALGERITRNVRKLVRREIHRALTAQELE